MSYLREAWEKLGEYLLAYAGAMLGLALLRRLILKMKGKHD